MVKKKRGKFFLILILIIVIGGWFVLNQKTSATFEDICNNAGWKAVPQTDAETGADAILCWKAEDPLIVGDGFTYDCGKGNEVVYYFVDRNPELVKNAMGDDLFNYVAGNCDLVGF
ncbi:hypothetical protein J4481_01275 [Candidatus Pacearchaeota archaeon]|nr:hypothetical protein [Candidatus Pacearchaeota archaeon]